MTLCHHRHRHRRPANNEQIVSLPSGRSFPIGALGNFRSLPHVRYSHCTAQARVEASTSAIFPFGRWKVFKAIIRAMGDLQARLARTDPAVLPLMVHDEMVTVPLRTKTPPPCKHKCKTCENPIGRWENVRSLHVPTVVDQSMGRSCASVSRGKHISNFPIGAMGTFVHECAPSQLYSRRSRKTSS